MLIFWRLCFPAVSAWSQELKPRAVAMGLFSSGLSGSRATPKIAEQILFQQLRNELTKTYDLSAQAAFEQALWKLEQTFRSRRSDGKNSCAQLKCVLRVHQSFPDISLFLLKFFSDSHTGLSGNRMSLIMVGENRQWRVKHESAGTSVARQTPETILKNLVSRMESYALPPMAVVPLAPGTPAEGGGEKKIAAPKTEQSEIAVKKQYPPPNIPEEKTPQAAPDAPAEADLAQKTKFSSEQLQFKLAERRYNALIWGNLKKDLMFFRQKNRKLSNRQLKTRLRLHINRLGKVTERRLLVPSGSDTFDRKILDSVRALNLPPPMEILVRRPPYVVTILIQP